MAMEAVKVICSPLSDHCPWHGIGCPNKVIYQSFLSVSEVSHDVQMIFTPFRFRLFQNASQRQLSHRAIKDTIIVGNMPDNSRKTEVVKHSTKQNQIMKQRILELLKQAAQAVSTRPMLSSQKLE